jgi:hypothetical protein
MAPPSSTSPVRAKKRLFPPGLSLPGSKKHDTEVPGGIQLSAFLGRRFPRLQIPQNLAGANWRKML